jgi:hypothetical protein
MPVSEKEFISSANLFGGSGTVLYEEAVGFFAFPRPVDEKGHPQAAESDLYFIPPPRVAGHQGAHNNSLPEVPKVRASRSFRNKATDNGYCKAYRKVLTREDAEAFPSSSIPNFQPIESERSVFPCVSSCKGPNEALPFFDLHMSIVDR